MTDTIATVLSDLERTGATVWRGFRSADECARLRDKAEQLLAGPARRQYPRSTRVYKIYQYGQDLVDLMCDPGLLQVAEQTLGEHPLVSDFSLNQVQCGGMPDKWHIDYPFNEMSHLVIGSSLGMQCILALSPFTAETGATEFVPGTAHRVALPAADAVDEYESFVAEPGDLLLMTAATWHRAGVNRTSTPRTAVLFSFVERWVRPMEDPALPGPWSQALLARRLVGMERPPEEMALDGGVPV